MQKEDVNIIYNRIYSKAVMLLLHGSLTVEYQEKYLQVL